jgi:hypothetical protein
MFSTNFAEEKHIKMTHQHIERERHETFNEAIETAVETGLAGEIDADAIAQTIYSGARLILGTALTLSLESSGDGIHPFDAVKLGVLGASDGALDLLPDEERMIKDAVRNALKLAMKHTVKDIQQQRQQLLTRVASGSA